jgi:hypothetical protein
MEGFGQIAQVFYFLFGFIWMSIKFPFQNIFVKVKPRVQVKLGKESSRLFVLCKLCFGFKTKCINK